MSLLVRLLGELFERRSGVSAERCNRCENGGALPRRRYGELIMCQDLLHFDEQVLSREGFLQERGVVFRIS